MTASGTMMRDIPLFVGRSWEERPTKITVVNPHDQRPLWTVSTASREDVDRAVAAAERALPVLRGMPAYARGSILTRTAALLEARREDAASTIMRECGKPIRLARAEVDRCVHTFSFAAEEARRLGGEVLPLDAQPEGEGRVAFTLRQPLGVIGAITPFNFPLNLVAHKVAPALAAGDAVVLKPSPVVPATAALLVEMLLEAGLPADALQLVHGGAEVGEALVRDPRVAMITFTGGSEAGRAIKAQAGMKRVTLELGSNSAAIVDRDADVEKAAARCVYGGFHYAGQSCISLQRIYVHRETFRPFVRHLLAGVAGLRVGDPADESTDVGPVISETSALRLEEWIEEARARGGEVLAGGRRSGTLVEPTVLANVDPRCRIASCEAFGPVVVVWPFGDFEEALAAANRSRFGLNAGIFTRDIGRAFEAARRLEAGAVLINDVPTFRVENMPYGGVKDSGIGREGVRYAIQEMTVEKLIVFCLR